MSIFFYSTKIFKFIGKFNGKIKYNEYTRNFEKGFISKQKQNKDTEFDPFRSWFVLSRFI